MQQLETQLAATTTEQEIIEVLNALDLQIKAQGQTDYSLLESERLLFFGQHILSLATKIESKPALYQCHQLLAEIYEGQGDRANALALFKQFHQLYKELEL
jgi:hypothetical protein